MLSEKRELIAEMLQSVTKGFDPTSTSGKAAVLRAKLGSVDPEWEMSAICACGWRGTFADIDRTPYDSGAEGWARHAGRSGWHYPCPKCGETIWCYYDTIN